VWQFKNRGRIRKQCPAVPVRFQEASAVWPRKNAVPWLPCAATCSISPRHKFSAQISRLTTTF